MKELTLEEKILELEKITETLEKEKLELNKSLELYEKAISLSKEITKELDAATKKVEMIQNSIKSDFE